MKKSHSDLKQIREEKAETPVLHGWVYGDSK